MSAPKEMEAAEQLDTSSHISPRPTAKLSQEDTPLTRFNKLLGFLSDHLGHEDGAKNGSGINKCQEAVEEMKSILSEHVDGNLAVSTDDLFAQQPLDKHVRSLVSNIAAPSMNKDAKRRSILQPSGSNSSLGSDSSSHMRIYRDMGLKNISEGQSCKPLDWDYDVHLLAKVTKNPLLHIIFFALGEFDLFSTLDLDESSISSFSRCIEKGYRSSNTYHNQIHATDVVQATSHLLLHSQAAKFNNLERFSLIIAAAIHDNDHPGVNNSYLINTEDQLALAYNDQSPLENHHVATAFVVMSKENCNITKNFGPDDRKRFREICISTVLATDMAKNFEIVGQFKNLVQSDPEKCIKWDNKEHVELVMKMILKLGDVSHPARKFATHYKWSQRCVEEFYMQGDKEKANGMEPLGFMDREKDYLPKSQMGFLQFVALPLYKPMVEFSPIVVKPLIENIENNIAIWKQYADANAKVPVTPEIYDSLCGDNYDPNKTYHPAIPSA